MLERIKAERPAVVLDAGNALFARPDAADVAAKNRARFILETMGTIGTQAMAVGARDLSSGLDFLKEIAATSKVPLLSANLLAADGKKIFPGHAVVSSGALKVGVIGISPVGSLGPNVNGAPIVASVKAELEAMKPRPALVVVLVAGPYADALQVAQVFGTKIDLVIQSGDERADTALTGKAPFVVASGERGRVVGELVIEGRGKGPLLNAGQRAQTEALLKSLEFQLAEIERRLKEATPTNRNDLLQTKSAFLVRQKTLQADLKRLPTAAQRSVRLTQHALGADVASDPAIEAQARPHDPIAH